MELVQFTTRSHLDAMHSQFPDALFYDTSTHAPYALDLSFVQDASSFSPFVPYGGIPIPGFRNKRSDSVEGIWQGLKVISGKIDQSHFHGKGRRRFGKVRGHQYGDRVLGYAEARLQIYAPSYRYMVKNSVPREILEKIYGYARHDIRQFFFDVDENPNIADVSSPFAHSSLLVSIINEELQSDNDSISGNDSRTYSARP